MSRRERNRDAVGITGIGAHVPPRVRSNAELSAILGVDESWIMRLTGIRERRIVADDLCASGLALPAAREALHHAGVEAGELGLIVHASSTPDEIVVASACRLQAAIGAVPAAALDVSGACTGFVNALRVAEGLMATDPKIRHALVVGSEVLSKFIDVNDRATAVLFGDGAGAVVLSRVPRPYGLQYTCLGADGGGADLVGIAVGGGRVPATLETLSKGQRFLHMRGKHIRSFILDRMPLLLAQVLSETGCSMSEIDLVIPHQANMRLIKEALAETGVPIDRVVLTGERYGNTGAASIPISLHAAVQQGRLRDGMLVLFVALGAGLTWGATLVRWSGPSAPLRPDEPRGGKAGERP
ncbi:3-oxoacyl-ACP synthase III family protein [Spirillospora sp. CA-253888]